MFSQIGGIFGVLLLVAGYIVGIFSHKIYMSSLMGNLYQVDKTENFGRSNTASAVSPKVEVEPNAMFNGSSLPSHRKGKTNDSFNPKIVNTWDTGNKDIEEYLEKVKQKIMRREPFKYSWKNIVYSVF